jgi:hypothetical protein
MHDPSAAGVDGRRRFLALVGLAGVSAVMGVRAASAAAPGGGSTPATPPPATPPPAAPAPPEISEDARALAAIVKRRHGAHLDDTMLQSITEEIENRLQGGRRLRGVRLANSDEPDATFRA